MHTSQYSIIQINETPSTNSTLKQMVDETEIDTNTILQASFQTAGKGQTGNFWESEKGKNLTFTLYIKPTFLPAGDMFLISKAVSVAIVEYLNDTICQGFSIKWPNDIYYKNKKVAGILIENQILGMNLKSSYIGIGLNVFQEEFKSNAPNPISLVQIKSEHFQNDINKELDHLLNNLAQKILSCIEKLLQEQTDWIEKQYQTLLYRNSGFHSYKKENLRFEARIIEVKNDGALLLEDKNGQQSSFYFKEVEFVL